MNITRDHIERLIIDRIILDTPAGIRISRQSNTSQIPKSLISNIPNFLSLPAQELRLDERLPQTLLNPIAAHIKLVAERYTNLRESTIPALSEDESYAYAAYYLLINIEKITRLLKMQTEIFTGDNLRVLDYGCGPGTGALALALLRKSAFTLSAIDSNSQMRKVALKLISELKNWGAIRSFELLPIESDVKGPFDLIIVGHVLNEMPVADQEKLLVKLLTKLSSTGTLLILESALPKQSRELMAQRDFLLAYDKTLKIVFPCTQQVSCPMLINSTSDWCHGSMNWNPPHLIRQLDQLTGFNKHTIKYSALIFKRAALDSEVSIGTYRVVAPTEQSKAGHSLSLCGDNFFGKTLLQKKSRSDDNIELRRAEHFDLLTLSGDAPLTPLFPASLQVSRRRAP
jgi:ribosomal protein RSM22 (predicted rRNA methylase)